MSELVDGDCAGIEINKLSEEIIIHKIDGMLPVRIDPDTSFSQVISRMVGKMTGEVEHIYVDLRRGPVDFNQLIAVLTEGAPLAPGSERRTGNLVAERMQINGRDFIHVSSGEEGISDSSVKALKYENALSYFSSRKDGNVPVGLDAALLMDVPLEQRKEFLYRYQHVVALAGDPHAVRAIESELGAVSEKLSRNRERFALLDGDKRVFISGEETEISDSNASVIRINNSQFGSEEELVMELAQFVASVGRSSASVSADANTLLKELISALYAQGEIPAELLGEKPLEALLKDPHGIVFPPIKQTEIQSIESYLRAQKYVESMA